MKEARGYQAGRYEPLLIFAVDLLPAGCEVYVPCPQPFLKEFPFKKTCFEVSDAYVPCPQPFLKEFPLKKTCFKKSDPFLALYFSWNLYILQIIYIHLSLQEEIVHKNFLMGVKFQRSWRNFREFSKTPSWREFLKNGLKSNFLEKL